MLLYVGLGVSLVLVDDCPAWQQEPLHSHLFCVCSMVCSPSTPAGGTVGHCSCASVPDRGPRVLGGTGRRVPGVLGMSALNSFVRRCSRKLGFPVPLSPTSSSRCRGERGLLFWRPWGDKWQQGPAWLCPGSPSQGLRTAWGAAGYLWCRGGKLPLAEVPGGAVGSLGLAGRGAGVC